MARKSTRNAPKPKTEPQDRLPTLKDMLNPDIVNKLKAQADEMKAAEQKRKEEQRLQVEEQRRIEQKKLENDFGHLLDNSKLDWRKYK